MIVPSGAVRVLVATRPVDFRKGMDGLAALVRESLGSNPYSGVIYVFRAKRADTSPRARRTTPRKPLIIAKESFCASWRGDAILVYWSTGRMRGDLVGSPRPFGFCWFIPELIREWHQGGQSLARLLAMTLHVAA